MNEAILSAAPSPGGTIPLPEVIRSPGVKQLQQQLSPSSWAKRVAEAHRRLAVVEALKQAQPTEPLSRALVRRVAPGVAWATVRHWWRWYHEREGEPWERLIDRRVVGTPCQIAEAWKQRVRLLGEVEPLLSWEQLRAALVAEYGAEAGVSDSTLRRILLEAGLPVQGRRGPPPVAVADAGPVPAPVTQLSGGGGLVLVLAAMLESGVLREMAEAVVKHTRTLSGPEAVATPVTGRTERGQFSAPYNRHRLAACLSEEGLFTSIRAQREHKDLRRLRLATLSAETLEQYLRCLVALPLLSERRSTAGLNGPAGAWLAVLSSVAYQAATLDKTLNELKWLDAAPLLWDCHARTWWQCSQRWAGAGWRQYVCYVDSSQDPWWTQRFAKSGRVSRTGRVQPCLSRSVLSSGPGVPIIAEVVSGQRPLDEALFDLLAQAEQILGQGALGRLTVVDAESCHVAPLRRFAEDPQRDLITVFKGPLARGKTIAPSGPWIDYRERDQVREAEVNLEPRRRHGLTLRVVEMRRPDSRRRQPTRFLTTASGAVLSTTEIADAYLSRWPYQEDLFRRGRNGVGLERSHGYGTARVTHIALIDQRERVAYQYQRAEQAYHEASEAQARAVAQLEAAKQRLEQRHQCEPHSLNGRHRLGMRQARQRLAQCQRQCKAAERELHHAKQDYQKLVDTPEEIYVRDTALEAVTTCLKLTLLALLEFICQEYLDHYRLMPRTFIDSWLALPVTIHERADYVLYDIAPNLRDPTMTQRLGEALERINQRRLHLGERQLVVRLHDAPEWVKSSET
jgi:hypothetical protein